MKMAVIATGGTFDKEYDEIGGTLYFKKAHLQEMLSMGRCRLALRIQVVMMKDSLEMTEADRRRILDACRACEEPRIVITHGTDTMVDTARFLEGKVPGKTVVLTGAMIPYTFGSSDGLFNLGSALSFAQVLSEGVFIAMNGRFFHARQVRKDRRRGIFVKSRSESDEVGGGL
jgi:L-asparaginase